MRLGTKLSFLLFAFGSDCSEVEDFRFHDCFFPVGRMPTFSLRPGSLSSIPGRRCVHSAKRFLLADSRYYELFLPLIYSSALETERAVFDSR